MFHSAPGRTDQTGLAAAILQQIGEQTMTARKGEALTLVPFLRSSEEIAFLSAPAGSADSTQVAVWSEACVVFRPLQELTNYSHPRREARFDFDRGIEALLSVTMLSSSSARSTQSSTKLRGWPPHFRGVEHWWP